MLCGVNLTGRRKFREQKTTSTDVSVDTIEEKALKDHSSSNEKRRFLTPRKWRAAFDVDGRLVNLPKTFRAILEGGVDPSIRPQVWEFLLGCYSIHSTDVERNVIREERRRRYSELLHQCSLMHSSIGSGKLPQSLGNRRYDLRSKDSPETQKIVTDAHQNLLIGTQKMKERIFDVYYSDLKNSFKSQEKVSNFTHRRGGNLPLWASVESMNYWGEDEYEGNEQKSGKNGISVENLENEDNWSDLSDSDISGDSKKEEASNLAPDFEKVRDFMKIEEYFEETLEAGTQFLDESTRDEKTPDDGDHEVHIFIEEKVPIEPTDDAINPVIDIGLNKKQEEVADWLFTLHKIAVDVVRTDQDMTFFNDVKNMSRVVDILALHAWIDPETGFCQGMCDILSPFIVFFENDADAFWCFECLISRIRHNFLADGPVGVMRQLAALRTIVALTDEQLSQKLMDVRAEDFMFAFRMLLVMFRREVPFEKVVILWEMMWAADFDPLHSQALTHNPPKALIIDLPPSLPYGFGAISTVELPQGPLFKGVWRKEGIGQRPPTISCWGQFRDGDEDISVFCVAAIMAQNREEILRELEEADDAMQIFNMIELKMDLKACIHAAIKMKDEYCSQLDKTPKSIPYCSLIKDLESNGI